MILGITGRREIPPIRNKLTEAIKILQPTKIISGMAYGTDLLAAEIAVALNIPFMAAIPFLDQERYYDVSDKVRYRNLLKKAESQVVICEGPYAKIKYQKRNEYIVDNSDKILAVFDGIESGGTYNCIKYAEKKNKEIIIFNI